MTSQVAIANAAVLKLGANRITNLSDRSPEAQAIEATWDRLRDTELRKHPWKFAVRRVGLGADTAVPAFGPERQFALPSDYLALVEVDGTWAWQTDAGPVWQIEGRKILTDLAAPLNVRYLRRVETTVDWDACFVEAFACRLALELCERITQSGSKKQGLRFDYENAVSDARRVDAIERSPYPVPEASWISARA